MKEFFVQRWFLLALVLLLTGGIVWAGSLRPISEWAWVRDGIVVIVMFCMSLPLEAKAMWRSMRNPGPPLLAVTVTYGILPLAAWATSLLLKGDLGPGLQVAAATPCTLASASVWTRRAGGNDAVAILVTIVTNASCFLVTPFWLLIMTGSVGESGDNALGKLSMLLAVLVVLPIAAAQLARRHAKLAAWSSNNKALLGVVAQCGILTMLFLGAIRTGLTLSEQPGSVSWLDSLVMIIAVLGLHLAMFWLGVKLTKVFRYSREDQIAVGIAGSQKTLTVGILMAMTLHVSILPMVAYHCLQLLSDTLIADAYRKRAGPTGLAGGDTRGSEPTALAAGDTD
jgi:sodium/bile acid cotransporter 7